ncbi:MAG TPA: NAD(P)-dependent oxidoreductase [Dehalococcoidia bacterium]|nr:NAD(P)-dependent oxidoreductase [Dehalococcoidia bacterium]
MKIAFLDPLEARLAEFPGRYLAGHECVVAPELGILPEGYEDAEAVVWSNYPVDAALVASMPKLRLMQRIGLTRAKGDASAALSAGVPVSVLPYGVSDRVALHTLSLTLAVLRRIVDGHKAVHEGLNPEGLPQTEQIGPTPTVNWVRWPDVDTLNDKTVGIIGFGEIGACFARMLPPFNNRVLYHKRNRLSPRHEAYFGVEYAPLDGLLSRSDVVISFVPYSEESRKMLGAREFGLMKPSAIFVNTGRGNTVDEAALVEALRSKTIRAAGIDVYSVEPLPLSNPLLTLDNVVLTPHTAGGVQGWMNTFERFAENVRRVEAGEPVIYPMRPDDPEPFA